MDDLATYAVLGIILAVAAVIGQYYLIAAAVRRGMGQALKDAKEKAQLPTDLVE